MCTSIVQLFTKQKSAFFGVGVWRATAPYNVSWPDYARSFLRHPIFLLPLLIPVMWFRFPTFDLRVYITAAVALLLYAGQKEESFIFLTNRVAVFLGDISYALYLVQWPLHCIATYYSDIIPM
ncbi:unnamed protein product, partial [Strongylus vulgaris]